MKEVNVIDRPYVVMKATIMGLYKATGKRVENCKHVSCGYVTLSDRRCFHDPQIPLKMPKPTDPYYTHYLNRYNEQLAHIATGCTSMWCVKAHGPRPAILDQKVKCTRVYFAQYSESELANPDTKADIMALKIDIANRSYHGNSYNMIVLYDLVNDKWYSDEWWSETQAGNLMPANKPITDAKPSQIFGIDEVVLKAKEAL